jgi:hypothetical protein
MKVLTIVALVGLMCAEGVSGEVGSAAPVVASPVTSYTIAATEPVCKDGKCCLNGKCFIKEPRFERNVAVSTTCDSCGVKETTRTVSRTRRRR